jgi:hypothetical protein
MKSSKENARKRKLSQNDDEIQVLKVRCGTDNVEVPKDDLQSAKKDTPKAAPVAELENKQSQPPTTDDGVDSAEEAMEDEVKSEEITKTDDVEENSGDSESKSELDKEEDVSETKSSPEKSDSDLEELPPSANTSLVTSTFNSSLLMDMDDKDSIHSISDIPITPMKDAPKVRKLTPKQIERQLESQKRREAKEKEKAERERQKQQEKEEKLKQREEKEKQKNQEKLEKQKKKQAEIE